MSAGVSVFKLLQHCGVLKNSGGSTVSLHAHFPLVVIVAVHRVCVWDAG